MKSIQHIFHNLLICALLITFTANAQAQTTKKNQPAKKEMSAADKKKAAEKKQKEKEKAKAQAEKEKQRAKAQAEKEKEKAKAQAAKQKDQAQRQKDQEQRQKEQAKRNEERARAQAQREREEEKRAAEEEKAKQAWLRQQEQLRQEAESPKIKPVHYINLSFRAGYDAMFDNVGAYGKQYEPDAAYPFMSKSLTGGYGAGLQLGYELSYKAFLFETGLGFDYLNSRSDYGFNIDRNALDGLQTWHYTTDRMAEIRNMAYVTLPVMFGAQVSNFYFLLGARVGYGLMGNYSTSGLYDITVSDDSYLAPYGMGVHDIPAPADKKLALSLPDVRAAVELGLDLDKWLQKQPGEDKKKVQAGKRLPFGREHVHYKIAAFAEYSVLNNNVITPENERKVPFNFQADKFDALSTNSVLAAEGSKFNNLFVGVRFTIQFEIPGKTPTLLPPPPSYGRFSVIHDVTGEPLENVTLQVLDTKSDRAVVKDKVLKKGELRQRMPIGQYVAMAALDSFYTANVPFSVDSVGIDVPVSLRMVPRPIFRVHVCNDETDQPLASRVQVRQRGTARVRYTIPTPAATGNAKAMLRDSVDYDLHIEQMGYEAFDAPLAYIGDSVVIRLTPIKKGEVFIMKNMFFATNKTRILDTSEESLVELFEYLDRTPDIRIKIIGHTDNVGKDDANQRLSEGRANAVREDLIQRGIAPERIEAEGRGESQPIDTNDTEEGRQNNRRVEIEIL